MKYIFVVFAILGACYASPACHVVQPGDSFWEISQKYGYNVAELQQLNPNKKPENLQVGDLISLPGGKGTTPTIPTSTDIYIIQKGDNFYDICQRQGYDLEQVLAMNCNRNINIKQLQAGQEIIIPGKGKCGRKSSSPVTSKPVSQPQSKPRDLDWAIQNDKPPAANPNNYRQDCLDQLNYARQHYSGAGDLVWDDNLATDAKKSADHCTNVAYEHTMFGHYAQIMFLSKSTCSAGYKGWITNEAPLNAVQRGHFKIAINPSYSKVGCSTVHGKNGPCIVCNIA